MKAKTFIQCGFEFTAATKLKSKMNSKSLTMCQYNRDSINKDYYDKISSVAWINDNFESDDCGLEIPSPKVKSLDEAIKYFNQFKRFVDKTNLSIDINKANNALGGCHIHLDTTPMTTQKRKLFLQNVGIFLTNYPQLNWGFNDVNDNYNANSLLNDNPYGSRFNPTSLVKSFLRNPTASISKRFALRYNHDYRTLELRIFDMPKNLKQHLLHSDVAQAIYHYCLRKTQRNETFELKYKKLSDYGFTLDQSIREFNKAMKTLGIDTGRTKEMIENIETRYEWNKKKNQNDIDTNYLV